MQALAHGRAMLVAASLLLASAGCGHRGTVQYPPSDAFFTNPPPEGTLTPAPTGQGDRPPARKARAPEAAGAAPAASTRSPKASAVPAASTPGAAAGAATTVPAGAAAATAGAAAVVAKSSVPAHDSTAATAKVGENQHVDELPVAITRFPPTYPEAARAAGTQGTVQLEAFVRTDGTVGDVRVAVSVPGLDEAAIAAVRQWTFKPGLSGGKPVDAWVGIPVRFAIH